MIFTQDKVPATNGLPKAQTGGAALRAWVKRPRKACKKLTGRTTRGIDRLPQDFAHFQLSCIEASLLHLMLMNVGELSLKSQNFQCIHDIYYRNVIYFQGLLTKVNDQWLVLELSEAGKTFQTRQITCTNIFTCFDFNSE